MKGKQFLTLQWKMLGGTFRIFPMQMKYMYMIKFLIADIKTKSKWQIGRLEKVSVAQKTEESLISLIYRELIEIET